MIRPKSAVLLSVPFQFSTKEQAVLMKRRVKQCFLSSPEPSCEQKYQPTQRTFFTSYIDAGPSLLNASVASYARKTRRLVQKEKKLKPCIRIKMSSLQKIQDEIRKMNIETDSISRTLLKTPSTKHTFYDSTLRPFSSNQPRYFKKKSSTAHRLFSSKFQNRFKE